jgi:hypothetical protein
MGESEKLMRIVLDRHGDARLEDADDFRAFSVAANCLPAALGAAVSKIGRLDEGGHAWIARSWLMEQGRSADSAWLAQFEAMSAYAAKAGWLDADGAIRAHVEFST